MFDIGWSELLVIGIVALVVIGPKELPGALRTLGQWTARVRRMAAEFQTQFQDAMREAEIDQLKKDMDDMAAKAKDYTRFDPLEDVRRDVEKSMGELPPLDQPSTAHPTEPTPTQSTPSQAETQTQVETQTALPPPADAPPAPEPAATPKPTAEPEPAVAGGNKPDGGRAPA
jgi:sec-independent protein translocase protein TatB